MRFFDFLFGSKSNSSTLYSSEEMIQLASKWTTDFLQSAPKLQGATYDKNEIYMFCGWITLDYGKNYGYLSINSSRNVFFETIFQAVRNTGQYNQSDMEQFMFRVSQYKSQMMGMLNCDYPRTKVFFPKTLYARFVHINLDYYHPDHFGIDDNLIQFSKYLGDFWNKVNSELMSKYPKK